VIVEFLGRGLRFPLRPLARAPHLWGLSWNEGEAQVAQSIWLILATAPGERLMRPEFGCGIHELVFEPNTPTLHGEVRSRVLQALNRFEPRIDVDTVEVGADPDGPEQLLIEIGYRIRASNAFFNLVYPFNLEEGQREADSG
jgi:phage baseplate assembly protein W